jgi:hypothetical protein
VALLQSEPSAVAPLVVARVGGKELARVRAPAWGSTSGAASLACSIGIAEFDDVVIEKSVSSRFKSDDNLATVLQSLRYYDHISLGDAPVLTVRVGMLRARVDVTLRKTTWQQQEVLVLKAGEWLDFASPNGNSPRRSLKSDEDSSLLRPANPINVTVYGLRPRNLSSTLDNRDT